MAMAQQMVKTMNESMQSMYVPGSGANLTGTQPAAPSLFYAVLGGNQAGPFSESELAQLIRDRKVDKETYVWKPGMGDWIKAENVPEVLKLVCLTPPGLPVQESE